MSIRSDFLQSEVQKTQCRLIFLDCCTASSEPFTLPIAMDPDIPVYIWKKTYSSYDDDSLIRSRDMMIRLVRIGTCGQKAKRVIFK